MSACREQRIHTDNRVNTRRHHRGGVDHRADGRGTFHRVRQPHVQRELRRFTNRTNNKEDTDQSGDAYSQAAKDNCRGFGKAVRPCIDGRMFAFSVFTLCFMLTFGNCNFFMFRFRRAIRHDQRVFALRAADRQVHNLAEAERSGACVQIGDTEQHDHVGYAGGHERLDRRLICALFLEPEADQHVRAQAHHFPADEQQQQVIRHHQSQHRPGKEGDQAEKARLARIVRHVANRINEDHRTCQRHHDQHHGGQRIDQNPHAEAGRACAQPLD